MQLPEIDHIAILVESLHQTLNSLKVHGVQCLDIGEFPEVGMKIAFAEYNGKILELLEVVSEDSPAAKHSKGLHHLAFEVDDLKNWHQTLSADSQFKTSPIRPGRHGDIFFFELENSNGIQYELMQKLVAK